MIGDMIDTFRFTTAAVNQEFARKIQIQLSTGHRVSYSILSYVNRVLFGFPIL